MSKVNHKEKTLLRVTAFGKRKNVTRGAVWQHINAGLIKVVYIGIALDAYIDWSQYRNYQFNENFKRR